METVQVLFRAPRRNIVRLCSIIEGYEGVAILRTVNATQGLLELLVAPAFHDTARALLHALAPEMELQVLDVTPPLSPSKTSQSSQGGC
jgi:hypothetical protein